MKAVKISDIKFKLCVHQITTYVYVDMLVKIFYVCMVYKNQDLRQIYDECQLDLRKITLMTSRSIMTS